MTKSVHRRPFVEGSRNSDSNPHWEGWVPPRPTFSFGTRHRQMRGKSSLPQRPALLPTHPRCTPDLRKNRPGWNRALPAGKTASSPRLPVNLRLEEIVRDVSHAQHDKVGALPRRSFV